MFPAQGGFYETSTQKNTTKKRSFFAVHLVYCLILCLLPVLCGFAGCSPKPDTADTIDFSHHEDGSRITKEELSAYQESVLTTLLITEDDGKLTGTHTGLFSTVVSVTLYDCNNKELLKDCFSLLAEYETILSRTMPGNELYAINQNTSGGAELSPILAEVLGLGLSFKEPSKERFDITVAPLSDLWAFASALPFRFPPLRNWPALFR